MNTKYANLVDCWQATKKTVGSPAALALITAAATYTGGRLLWNPIASTAKSLFRVPAKKLMGMSDAEWDSAMEELKSKDWAHKIPAWVAALSSLGVLGLNFRPNQQYFGELSFDAPPRPYQGSTKGTQVAPQSRPMVKGGSLEKRSLFDPIDPYVSDINYARQVDARYAKSLFNDPLLRSYDPYAANFGTSVIANAARLNGNNSLTLGNVYDSAMDKFDSKLSLGSMLRTGARTIAANCMSKMFTGALDTMIGLPEGARQGLIDAGTWAGAISSIID